MPTIEIIQKPLPALRLTAMTTSVSARHEIAEFVGSAFDSIAAAIGCVKGALDTPVVEYDMQDDGIAVTAGYAVETAADARFETVDLPAVETAVCGVHLGDMTGIAASWQAIHEEIIARGFVPSGPCRELYVRAVSDDQADWVTELQQPVVAATPTAAP